MCKPGYYYPWWHDGPFLGMEIEQATKAEYDASFDCLAVEGKSCAKKFNNFKIHVSFIDGYRGVATCHDYFPAEHSVWKCVVAALK